MRVMTLEESKSVELDILSYVAEFCDNNGLKYFLAYGTLIGAIRHKGFIPWDDDVDIWMPRDDYKKLMDLFNKNSSNRYKLISPYDSISRHTFVKIVDTRTVKIEQDTDYKNGFLGVDIDVFPLDGEPADDTEYDKWYDKLQKYYKVYPYLVLSANTLKRKIGFPIIKFLSGGKRKILRKTATLHNKYIYNESSFVGAIESCHNFKNNRYKKEWFEDFILVDFENKKFKAPVGYDKILTKMYGDYMKLPPEEKRVTHHKNNVFWLEDNYEKI